MSVQEVIVAADVHAAERRRTSLVAKMAGKYGLEPDKMMATLKATAFKGDVTNEQMAALMIVADQHGLNPWTKEIYAFPSRNGIVPVVGVDGWARIINEHPNFDGMDFAQDDEKCTCTIYRKDRSHPIAVTEYRTECERPTDPWKTHPKRMLRHKAMIQCARIAFAFAGIYDPDEAERVLAADAIDVTPEDDEPILKKGPVNWKDRAPRISPKRMRKIVEALVGHAEKNEGAPILEIIRGLHPEEYEQVWKALRSWEHTAIKKALAMNDAEIDAATLKDPPDDLLPWAKDLLASCVDMDSLNAAWGAVEGAYDASGQATPDELATICDERRTALGV